MSTSIKQSRSALAAGPSGSGKSTLLRSALLHEGSGVVLLAPGADEINSYDDLDYQVARWVDGKAEIPTDTSYLMMPVDDEDFLPSIGETKADGLVKALTYLRGVYKILKADVDVGDPPRWRVLGNDTLSAVGDLAYNAMLSGMGVTEPPKARGDGGATFYSGLQSKVLEVCRVCRAIRGLGVHWIATTHVKMADASETYTAEDVSVKAQRMPLFTGAVREKIPAIFDLVFYTGVERGKHYMIHKPDPKRAAKSRMGLLADGRQLPNDWVAVLSALEDAVRPTPGANVEPLPEKAVSKPATRKL